MEILSSFLVVDDKQGFVLNRTNRMLRVLVTGASGYIASHVILQLLESGYEVVGTLRDQSQEGGITSSLSQLTDRVDNLSFVDLNLLDDYQVYQKAVKGCHYVIHLASPFPQKPPKNDDEVVLPAKNSILNILRASSESEVRRVVFTSSIGAVAYGVCKTGEFDEEDWTDYTNKQDTSAYFRSKAIADQVAFEYLKDHSDTVQFTSVAAGLVMGPLIYDTFGTSVGIIKSVITGKYPTLPGVGYSVVDVRSLATLLVQAMERPQAGDQRFCATGQWVTFPQMAEILKDEFPDYPVKTGEMPKWLVKVLSWFSSELQPILIDLDSHRVVRSDKAKKLLGWESISAKDMVIDTARSLIEKGLVD
jgi:dihydroflavonol-4-reductase